MALFDSDQLKITSNYGNREFYYQGKLVKDFHTGVDIIPQPKVENAPVLAFFDGVVTDLCNTGKNGGKACFVRIHHDCGLDTLYYHLASGSVCVKKGAVVKANQKIGEMGNTGMSTASHLHFQIDKGSNSTSIDPLPYLTGKKSFEVPKVNENKGSDYVCLYDMRVRSNAGTIYPVKLVKQLTVDGKKNALNKNENAFAVYKKGTIFTALDIIKNKYGTWARTPSGYVCLIGASGTVYCEKK